MTAAEAEQETERVSACPVKHDKPPKFLPMPEPEPETERVSACPVKHDTKPKFFPMDAKSPIEGCDSTSPTFSSPAQVGDDFPDAKPDPAQRAPLPTAAVSSTIPKGGEKDEGATWVYPSPQRFYNAMKKKGWNPQEHDMDNIVQIHNHINERCWLQVPRLLPHST
jgi:cytochrome c heme-lyase